MKVLDWVFLRLPENTPFLLPTRPPTHPPFLKEKVALQMVLRVLFCHHPFPHRPTPPPLQISDQKWSGLICVIWRRETPRWNLEFGGKSRENGNIAKLNREKNPAFDAKGKRRKIKISHYAFDSNFSASYNFNWK